MNNVFILISILLIIASIYFFSMKVIVLRKTSADFKNLSRITKLSILYRNFPLSILAFINLFPSGVIAYVEVRMGSDNRSQVIKEQLKVLGAEVRDRLSPDTTHVIFKDGSKVGMDRMEGREGVKERGGQKAEKR